MNEMSMKVGDNSWSMEDKIAIIDSGTSFNLMPTKDIKKMLTFIQDSLNI
jgi:hypothetical protein